MNSVFTKTNQKTRAGLADRVKIMSVSAIKEMAILAQQYPEAISMSWGLPPFATPENIRQAAIKALQEDDRVGKYSPSQGLPELRVAIKDRLIADRDWDIDPDKNLIVTAGAMQGLTLAFQTLVSAGDEVILTNPGFASHIQQIQMAGGVAVEWNLNEDKGWQLDINQLKNLITSKTRAIVISTPCNPTGSVFSKEEIDATIELALKHDIFIIADEPYDFLLYDEAEFYSPAHNPAIRKNLILLRSFSKNYSMTGFRVGFVVAEEGLRNEMLKIHDATVISAPSVCQFAAIEALTGPQDSVEKLVADFSERREVFFEEIAKQSDIFNCHKPMGAYYAFPRIELPGVDDDYDFAIDLLKRGGVVTVPGSAFGSLGKKHLRMTFCAEPEQIRQAFGRIRVYVDKY